MGLKNEHNLEYSPIKKKNGTLTSITITTQLLGTSPSVVTRQLYSAEKYFIWEDLPVGWMFFSKYIYHGHERKSIRDKID